MGAETFNQESKGKTVREAYCNAKEIALFDHGHSGYTGTIAEKNGFIEAKVPQEMSAYEYADFLERAYRAEEGEKIEGREVTASDLRIIKEYNDKWGNAIALKIKTGVWLFVGIASC